MLPELFSGAVIQNRASKCIFCCLMQRGSLTKYDVVCLWHFDIVDTGLNSQCPTVAEDLGFDPVDRGRKYEFNYL